MGLNTPAIILNDKLHDLERAPDAGMKISRAVQNISRPDYSSESIGVKALPSGHSSAMQIVAVGGNTIRRLAGHQDCGASDEDLLRSWANDLGFRLVAKDDALLKAAKRALNTFKAQDESVRRGNVLGALEDAIDKAEGRA